MDSNTEKTHEPQLERIRKALELYMSKITTAKCPSQNLVANTYTFWQCEQMLLQNASHLIDWDIWVKTLLQDYQQIPDARNEINNLLAYIKMFIDQSHGQKGTKTEINISLPCSPGDTIYIIESEYKGRKKTGEKIVPAIVDRFIIGHSGIPMLDACTDDRWYYTLAPGQYYLSYEEAKAEINTSLPCQP